MKHLLVFSPYYPPHVGGLESHAHEFNIAISKLGHHITIVTTHIPSHPPLQESISPNINVIRLPSFEILTNYPLPKIWRPVFWKSIFLLLQLNPDVIISRTRFFYTTFTAAIFARILHKPWLHIEHGSELVYLSNPFLTFLSQAIDRLNCYYVFNQANYLVANSHATQAFVQRFLRKPTPIHVIYRGLNLNKINQASSKPLTPPPSPQETSILFIGRLVAGKGVKDLIRSISYIQHPVQCYIVGTGPELNRLKRLASHLKLSDKCHFLGQYNHYNTIQLVKSADIIVNPSYSEGLPTSLLEAAAFRKAIIATNIGGTPEIIKHNYSGLLYSPHNITILAHHLNTLINRPDLQKAFGENAYQNLVSNHSWEHNIRIYQALINQICAA